MTRPYVVAIIQARLGSTRFPRKVLSDIHGKPLLAHLIHRVRHAQTVQDIVLATPDDEICAIAGNEGIWALKGSEEDVLGRYYKAARDCGADVVVRITADCPLIDAGVIDGVVRALGTNDFASNAFRRTFPKGLDVEVMWTDTLNRLHRLAETKEEIEHVTWKVYTDSWLFKSTSYEDIDNNSHLNWCVDYPEDLVFIRKAYEWMNGTYKSYAELLEWSQS